MDSFIVLFGCVLFFTMTVIIVFIYRRNRLLMNGAEKIYDGYLKMKEMSEIYSKWLKNEKRGIQIKSYFEKNGIHRIAIYGANDLCSLLRQELSDTDVKVDYIIDRNAKSIKTDIDVFFPENDLKKTDAIIVTAVHYFDEICSLIEQKVNCPIISIGELL